jgi:hypothetical protein
LSKSMSSPAITNNLKMSYDKILNIKEARQDVEALIALLWALAWGALTAVPLEDIPDSP